MGASIDQLQIDVNAQAVKANDALDKLANKLDRLQNSLGSLNSSNLTSLANGVQRLGTAMQTMNSVKTADFTRLAKNIEKLSVIDAGRLNQASASIHHFVNSLGNLKNLQVSETASQIAQLAKGIAQLGYKSSSQAIKNIPKLAVAMRQLMSILSNAPKVSRNLIDMTNALAELARTGASSGHAANSLKSSFDKIYSSSLTATKGINKLKIGFGNLFRSILPFLGIRQLFQWGKEAVGIASNLTEVQNVVDVTFGKYASLVDKMSESSIVDFGMSELTVKKISSRFQAMGTAMGFAQGRMADMSIELTKLTADMASFYNVEQADVAEDLESIFTGQTRPLRTYGLDLTQATLQEWAMKQGLDANIQSMSQAEKALLRYQYVLSNTGAAQGDFVRTADTWANQVRILKQNFQALGAVIGGTFINALKPMVKALNNAMSHIIAFAKTISNALGKIFGWTYEEGGGGIASDFESAADSTDDIAGGLSDAEKAAKKIKTHLLGIDELNVIEPDTGDTGNGSGDGGGSGAGGAGADGGQWVKTDSIFKNFESEIDTLYKLGEYIGNALSEAMEGIDWEKSYEKARNWGKGLADFLNGLISPRLFENLGKTVAGSLNTALHFLNSFGKTFEWEEFGVSLSASLKGFFEDWDAELTGETLSTFAKGLLEAAKGAIDKLKDDKIFEEIGQKIVDFICGIDWTGIVWDLGGFFLSLADAIAQFPIDLANGIMQEIADKIFWEKEVEIKLPELSGELADTSTILNPNSSFGEKIFASFDLATKLQEELEKVNILFEQKRQEFLAWWDENIGAFWEEHVSPWFTEEKWLELYDTIRSSLETKWGEVKEWWSGTAIVSWWEEDVKPWFKLEKWLELLDTIKKSFKTKWDETAGQWSLDVKTWWDKHVMPWFTKERWLKLGENLKNGIYEGFKGVANKVIGVLNNVISSLESLMNSAIDGINSFLSKINSSKLGEFAGFDFHIGNVSFNRIPAYEIGGFPEDGLFMANSTELVGRFSNGRTAVANNAQIIEGIQGGVARAIEVALAPYLSDIARNTRETADKDLSVNIGDREIYKASERGRAETGYEVII